MPRYPVKRAIPRGPAISADDACALVLAKVVELNAKRGVTSGRSHITQDGAEPDAIRDAAQSNGRPVDEKRS